MIADFSKKRRVNFGSNKFLFPIIGVLFLIIIAVLFFADFKIYQRKQELISQIDSYKKQIEEIKKSSQKLEEKIVNADSKDYLEKIAYEQLGQQKPGEQEVIFVAPQQAPKPAEPSKVSWTDWLLAQLSWVKSWLKSKF